MKQPETAQEKFNQLRKQAEDLMVKKNFSVAPVVFEDPLTLIHELQTLQIELELQNQELQRSQQELMESQIHYAELYDFAPQGYVTLSLKGVILKSNLTFADMLSMEKKHLINQPLSAYIIFKDQDIYYRHMRNLSDLKTQQACDLRMKKKKGLPFDVHLESNIRFDELGDPEQYRTIVIDNSEQKKAGYALEMAKEELEARVKDRTKKLETANRQLQREIAERKAYEQEKMNLEKQLRQAQKMEALGTLSSGIAHDFNNILTSIIAFTQLLEMQKFPDIKYMENSLNQILQSAYQARDLVKQIMMFSRKTEQIKEPVMLDLVIRDVVNMMRASLPSTINIREQISVNPCIVLADPVQMHQVLMNVCTNAAQAMRTQTGILKIQMDMTDLGPEQCKLMNDIPPGKYAQIMISDTGQGIPPENIQKIFDPYFTTKKPGEGTGLGLSVTHGIIKNHGGAILVDSHLGQGTTFKLLVPYFFEPDIRAKDASPPLPISPGNATVLFVDDEVAIAMGVKMVLAHLGYDIVVKTSGTKALAAFSQAPERFDILITDLTMPEMTGDVLASKIKKIRSDMPVILCTGLLEEDSEIILSKYNVDAFIQKPYNKQALIESIQRVIEKTKQKKPGSL